MLSTLMKSVKNNLFNLEALLGLFCAILVQKIFTFYPVLITYMYFFINSVLLDLFLWILHHLTASHLFVIHWLLTEWMN